LGSREEAREDRGSLALPDDFDRSGLVVETGGVGRGVGPSAEEDAVAVRRVVGLVERVLEVARLLAASQVVATSTQ
jgi:hypothetical protein